MCLTEPDIEADDPYKVLGVHNRATDKEIGAAYKRLALRYHPDKNINSRSKAERAFKLVTGAYETLRDPAKRKTHDYSSSKSYFSGNVGSSERTDDLYRMFFAGDGGTSATPNIDIAGIFNFDQKPRAKTTRTPVNHVNQPYLISAGTAVVIHGLASSPEHNGKSGKVREWSVAKGRYDVSLNCGGVLSLRPQNLTQLCNVLLHFNETEGGKSADLNGKSAEVVDFNEQKGFYVLLLNDPPSVVELPAKHCIFPVGAAAVLEGLSDKQLNGQMCSVLAVDLQAQRYTVQCEGGRQLKVRFERIMC